MIKIYQRGKLLFRVVFLHFILHRRGRFEDFKNSVVKCSIRHLGLDSGGSKSQYRSGPLGDKVQFTRTQLLNYIIIPMKMGLDKCLVIFDQSEISMARFNPFNNLSDMGINIDRACCKGVRISLKVKGHQIIPILKYFRPQISHKRVDKS